MTRRMLAPVITAAALLVAASTLSQADMSGVWAMAQALPADPWLWTGVALGGSLLIVSAAMVLGRLRNRSRAAVEARPPESAEFRKALDTALEPEIPALRAQVLAAARSGGTEDQIARSTRLSRDAVRAVLARG